VRRALLLGTVAATLVLAPSAHAYIYWGNVNNGPGSIGRANNDGTGVDQNFITGLNTSMGLAVDGSHIYWVNGGSNTIGRANLDGTGVNQSFITGSAVNAPSGVTTDSNFIYWTNAGSSTIGRANLDGTSPTGTFVTGTGNLPCGIAVNAGHIYWGEAFMSHVGRANLNGSGGNPNFITTNGSPCGVAVNLSNIFWALYNSGGFGNGTSVGRAGIDGLGVDDSYIGGGNGVCGVALDATHVYWTNTSNGSPTGTVGRANLDTSGVNQSFIHTGSTPCGIAVDGLGPNPGGNPSNVFTIGKAKLNRKKGTATLPVTVPGPGTLVLSGKGLKQQRPRQSAGARVSKAVSAAGTVKLRVVPKGRTKRKLRRTGRAKVRPTITFTPTGGSAAAQRKTIKLVRR
jgi:virginiamycin B lyase